MVEVVAMTVVSGRTIMARFVWSIISSLLGNALLHDDALNDIICGLVVVFCVSVSIEGESGILVIYCEDRIWERESS